MELSRVISIPRVKNQNHLGDYRPISIQTALSKVYEKLVLKQIKTFISENKIYKETITGFKKKYSRCTALIKLRDNIIKVTR